MISLHSLKNFITINFTLLIVSAVQEYFGNNLLWIIFRNLTMVFGIDLALKNKKDILNYEIKEKYEYEFIFDTILASFVEFLTFYILNYRSSKYDIFNDLCYFIPISFIFEIIFDLFHYITHRIFHIKYLYLIHKHHHEHNNIKSIIAFHQNPLDLIVTNSVPFYITLKIVSNFYEISNLILSTLIVYKIYTEICGHIGKESKTSSFPQFIWLPKLLGIELYSDDHLHHHMYVNCNYSKRFCLWDKIFGTMK